MKISSLRGRDFLFPEIYNCSSQFHKRRWLWLLELVRVLAKIRLGTKFPAANSAPAAAVTLRSMVWWPLLAIGLLFAVNRPAVLLSALSAGETRCGMEIKSIGVHKDTETPVHPFEQKG